MVIPNNIPNFATHTFDAKNSKDVTVNGKKYKKIDEKGITLDF
nr:hypothetical protein [Prevotella sp.]